MAIMSMNVLHNNGDQNRSEQGAPASHWCHDCKANVVVESNSREVKCVVCKGCFVEEKTSSSASSGSENEDSSMEFTQA